jgi:hypothetical protein
MDRNARETVSQTGRHNQAKTYACPNIFQDFTSSSRLLRDDFTETSSPQGSSVMTITKFGIKNRAKKCGHDYHSENLIATS